MAGESPLFGVLIQFLNYTLFDIALLLLNFFLSIFKLTHALSEDVVHPKKGMHCKDPVPMEYKFNLMQYTNKYRVPYEGTASTRRRRTMG